MSTSAHIISLHTADTSGVCSMLYELGGMVVVHDASGCNSTYATHDEPRWSTMKSQIFISALTETDAIMGNDEKFVTDTCSTASTLKPKFIAICGSPMPMMTGTDFDALAREIEARTDIPVIPLHTNGMQSYITGASEALTALLKRFAAPQPKVPNRVNVLGLTPLDFGNRNSVASLRSWLQQNHLEPGAMLAMDCTLEDIVTAPAAAVNLVVSTTGLAAAQYLEATYGQPYVIGVPYGTKFAQRLADALTAGVTAAPGTNVRSANVADATGTTVVLGEAVHATSLASALSEEYGVNAVAAVTLEHTPELLAPTDFGVETEDAVCAALSKEQVTAFVGDPMYLPIAPAGLTFHSLPSVAFSGRCYLHLLPDLITTLPC